MSDAFAELWLHSDPGILLALGAADVYVKWDSSMLGEAGPTDLLVPDAIDDDMTVGPNGAGLYDVAASVSYGSDKVASEVKVSVFLNGVVQDKLSFHRTVSNANAQGVGAIVGAIRLAVGDVLDLRFLSTVINTDLTLYHVVLLVRSILRDL